MKNKCEAVLAPANTSHFLQPCDQDVNKTFQGRVRLVRDELTKYVITDTKSIGVKLMCGVCAFKEISAADCAMAFCKTGIYPFQRDFASRFRPAVIELDEDEDQETHTEE